MEAPVDVEVSVDAENLTDRARYARRKTTNCITEAAILLQKLISGKTVNTLRNISACSLLRISSRLGKQCALRCCSDKHVHTHSW